MCKRESTLNHMYWNTTLRWNDENGRVIVLVVRIFHADVWYEMPIPATSDSFVTSWLVGSRKYHVTSCSFMLARFLRLRKVRCLERDHPLKTKVLFRPLACSVYSTRRCTTKHHRCKILRASLRAAPRDRVRKKWIWKKNNFRACVWPFEVCVSSPAPSFFQVWLVFQI
jgi:hypothetical protein